MGCQGPRDEHPLLLPTRQWSEGPPGPIRHAHAFQGLNDDCPVGAGEPPKRSTMRQPTGSDYLPHGGVLDIQGGVLWHISDTVPVPESPERGSKQFDGTLLERSQRCQGAKQGGLAGAVRTDDGYGLAGVDMQVDVPENRQTAEKDVNSLGGHQRLGLRNSHWPALWRRDLPSSPMGSPAQRIQW